MAPLPEYILSMPPVTRFFLIATIAVSLGISVGLLSPSALILHPSSMLEAVVVFFHRSKSKDTYIWALKGCLLSSYKIFTYFFVVDGLNDNGVRVLLGIYRFYTFSNHLESSHGHFRGNFPDFLWFVLVSGGLLVGINLIFAYLGYHTSFYHSQLSSCMTYLWSRTSMNTVTNFLGLVPIKAYYLPLFDLGVAIMSGQIQAADSLAGILAGYVYECFQSDTLPIYNLMPGAYGQRNNSPDDGRRVGFNFDTSAPANVLLPSIFDLGYLKAPAFLYRLLKYPMNTSVRTTAFSASRVSRPTTHAAKARTTGYQSASSGNFRGKGHRLGT